MKKIYLVLAVLLLTSIMWAQSPQKMSYQAVVRDASDALVTNNNVGMQISILQGSLTGTAIYVETHTPTTNVNGLVSLEIGSGTVISGTFSTIDWSNGPYFIKTETDPTGGTAYSITGTSELLSVPYALYAANAGNSTPGPQGPVGATGPQGPQGPAGADGNDGAIGATGPQGNAGVDGKTILNGTITPTGATGVNGDFYINTTSNELFGPKTAGNWGTGVSLVGPAGSTGAQGSAGVDGNTILNGTSDPTGTTGNNGDFYINTTSNELFGPKTAGAWGTGVPLGGASSSCNYSIGGTLPSGAIIFYLDPTGCHGLACAPTDQSTATQWEEYSGSYTYTTAFASSIGGGMGNTSMIVHSLGNTGAYAAKICNDFSIWETDWYLPSVYELQLMYQNIGPGNVLGLGNVGGFSPNPYWSSTEVNDQQAYTVGFITYGGNPVANYKTTPLYRVRAIRAF